MALSKESVEKAKEILATIGGLKDNFTAEYDKEYPAKTGVILVEGKKWDGGYDAITLNIEDISPAQVEMWQKYRSEIPNSSVFSHLRNNITRIGWF